MAIFILFVLVRMVTGLMFIHAGYVKLFKDRLGKAIFFERVGFGPGLFYVYAIGLVELFGGICLIFGLLAKIVGIVLGLIILGAVVVKLKDKTLLKRGVAFYALWALVCFYIALR